MSLISDAMKKAQEQRGRDATADSARPAPPERPVVRLKIVLPLIALLVAAALVVILWTRAHTPPLPDSAAFNRPPALPAVQPAPVASAPAAPVTPKPVVASSAPPAALPVPPPKPQAAPPPATSPTSSGAATASAPAAASVQAPRERVEPAAPSPWLRWQQEGDRLADAGELPEAVEAYRRALAARPEAALYLRLARTLLAADNPIAAQGYLQDAVRLYPADGELRYWLVILHLRTRHFEEAAAAVAAARREGAAEPRLSPLAGLALLQLGRHEAALAEFSEAQRRLGDNPEYTYYLALCSDHLQRYPQAFLGYTRFLQQAVGERFAAHRRWAERRLQELRPALDR